MSSREGECRVPWLRPLWILLALLCVCQVGAWCPLVGTDDFWAHAAVGRWTWQHGEVPHHTLFLWTTSEPWVAHSWLSQVMLYALLALGGTWLVWAFTVVMVALPFLILWRLWRRFAPVSTVTVVVFGLAINGSALRFQA